MKINRPSLKKTLRELTIKWAVAGLALSLLAGGACLLYSSKYSSESQAKLLAQSIGRAFRPQILRGDIRDAQFQMEFVLADLKGSHARVLNPNFSEIYSLPGDAPIACKKSEGFCWNGIHSITYLHPIYFDDEKKDGVYGYLSLTTPTEFNLPILFSFSAFILLLFVIQAFGLISALGQISKSIHGVLTSWSIHLSTDPKAKVAIGSVTHFTEFEPMEDALGQLHLTISKLEAEAAKQAKENAQVSIIREIGHDLKTPLSQVAKHFYLLSQEAGASPGFNRARAVDIERIFKRMGDLVRQIQDFHEMKPRESDLIDLTTEVTDFVESNNKISDGLRIHLDCDRTMLVTVQIQKIRFYQLLDNLIRNARDATPSDGSISVTVSSSEGLVELVVQDTGSGIAAEIRDNVFDIDFTTKPGKGTGLGLGIVKRICSEIGAIIQVESEDGMGTKITIRIPIVANTHTRVPSVQGEMTV